MHDRRQHGDAADRQGEHETDPLGIDAETAQRPECTGDGVEHGGHAGGDGDQRGEGHRDEQDSADDDGALPGGDDQLERPDDQQHPQHRTQLRHRDFRRDPRDREQRGNCGGHRQHLKWSSHQNCHRENRRHQQYQFRPRREPVYRGRARPVQTYQLTRPIIRRAPGMREQRRSACRRTRRAHRL